MNTKDESGMTRFTELGSLDPAANLLIDQSDRQRIEAHLPKGERTRKKKERERSQRRKPHRINLDLPLDLKKRLEAQAKRDGVPISQLVAFLLYEPLHLLETRAITVMNHVRIPLGNYGLIEMYCNEPACDCRRVFFDVYDWERGTSIEDVAAATREIVSHVGWIHLDEGGERIQQVLDGIDPRDEDACLEAWFKHLAKTLNFPFEAELTEHEFYGPIRAGDTIRVIRMNGVFEDYGILVDVKKERKTYQPPLADLKVKDNQAPQYQVVEDYAVWFANR